MISPYTKQVNVHRGWLEYIVSQRKLDLRQDFCLNDRWRSRSTMVDSSSHLSVTGSIRFVDDVKRLLTAASRGKHLLIVYGYVNATRESKHYPESTQP